MLVDVKFHVFFIYLCCENRPNYTQSYLDLYRNKFVSCGYSAVILARTVADHRKSNIHIHNCHNHQFNLLELSNG